MGLSCYPFCADYLVAVIRFNALMGLSCYTERQKGKQEWKCFNALMGLSCYGRMSNILNFSWYFLCIPAIYRCILAYLPIFFNQLSKFLRCESPSTFLGTCLSHHYFIIFLVTNTNTLLSGLYLISTVNQIEDRILLELVSMPSRAYTSFLRMILLTLSLMIRTCQCPLGLIPHFYGTPSKT